MKAGWLIGGVVIALMILGWSAYGDTHLWLVKKNAATTSVSHGYGRGQVAFAQVVVDVEIPLTEDLQHQGLAGRTHLGPESGMLFQYATADDHTFWMKGMLIPLDFIWIANDQIIALTLNAPPPTPNQSSLPVYRAGRPVTDVLEVQGGFVAEHDLKVGDVVEITRR